MNNVNGILLIIGAMVAFTLEDMFIKHLSAHVSTGQIMVVLGVACGLLFCVMAVVTRKRIFAVEAWQLLPVARAAMEALGALTFMTALALVEFSTVAAVFQALPLAVTMGAALFLREQVGWRRWSAVGVGLIGVLMIIRPGLEGFRPEALYVVVAVICVAARDLITRRIDVRVASSVVAMQAYLAVVVAGSVLMVMSGQPVAAVQNGQVAYYIGAILFSMLGYYGIVTALRIAEASAVTPYRYTRLVFSLLVGVLVFGDRPDPMMLAGATLIIGSGLYTFLRERRLANTLAATA